MLDKTKLGKRYTCYQCGTKFYDLNRPEPLCPDCEADQTEAPTRDIRSLLGKGKRAAARDAEKKKKVEPVVAPTENKDSPEGAESEESEGGADSDNDDSLGLLGLDKAT